MNYRRWSRVAEWGVVAAVVALNAGIFFWPENPSQPNFLLAAAHDAQLLSVIVLVIGWVVLGPGHLWLRLIAAPALVWLWFLPWNAAMQPREMTAAFIKTFFWAAAVLICGLRVCGLRISKRSATDGPEPGAQFSLLALIVATTLIAIAIGSLEALRPALRSTQEDYNLATLIESWPSARIGIQLRELVMAATVAFTAAGGLWVVVRPGAPWLRLAALAALVPGAGLYLSHLSGASGVYLGLTDRSLLFQTAAYLTCGLMPVAGLAALSVLPLRLMNFRLQRPLQSAPEVKVRRQQAVCLAQRVAAIFLLGAAIGVVPVSGVLNKPDMTADPGRINGGAMVWSRIHHFESNQAPMNTFARWIDDPAVSTWDVARLAPYFAIIRARHLRDMSQAEPIEIELVLDDVSE
jgi:hypothetical protein